MGPKDGPERPKALPVGFEEAGLHGGERFDLGLGRRAEGGERLFVAEAPFLSLIHI